MTEKGIAKHCRQKPGRDKAISSKYIKILHYNIEGVKSEVHGNKFDDDDFLTMIKGHDLVAITETHAGKDMPVDIPGYIIKQTVRPKSPKAKKYSGGIILAVKENIVSSVKIIKSKSDNIMWAKIERSGNVNDVILGIVYVSPINSTYTKNVLSSPFETRRILG